MCKILKFNYYNKNSIIFIIKFVQNILLNIFYAKIFMQNFLFKISLPISINIKIIWIENQILINSDKIIKIVININIKIENKILWQNK